MKKVLLVFAHDLYLASESQCHLVHFVISNNCAMRCQPGEIQNGVLKVLRYIGVKMGRNSKVKWSTKIGSAVWTSGVHRR